MIVVLFNQLYLKLTTMAILLDAKRKEWEELLLVRLQVKLSSLPLQLKLNALRVAVKNSKTDVVAAAHELCNYCNANVQAYERDLKAILKNLN